MNTDMNGKVALITGASGEIGAEIARMFADAGVSVALHYHSNQEAIDRLAKEISTRGVKYLTIKANLADEKQVMSLWKEAEASLGPIEILIANAGMYREELIGIKDMSVEAWNQTLNTNLTSVFLCFREFFRSVEKHKIHAPSAVMIGSMSGIWGDIGHCDYASSKAGMLSGLLPTLKDELTQIAANGRINAVAPGFIRTQMISGVLQDQKRIKRVLQTASLRRIGTVRDVAATTVFLSSNALSAHITGEVIQLKGGKEGRILHEEEDIDLDF